MSENIESNQPEPSKKIEQPSVKLDDLLVSAGRLYKGLILLSNKKFTENKEHKKEVITMPPEKSAEEVKNNEILKTPGGRTYFFDIEQTKTGNPYLKITESHFNKQSNKAERNTIIIFQEGIREFAAMLIRIALKIGESQQTQP